MHRSTIALIFVALITAGCGGEPAASDKIEPATVEPIGDTGRNRLVLTEKAVERIGIRTGTVSRAVLGGKVRKAVPYGSVLYDAKGTTFVYINPEPMIFIRREIRVLDILGSRAYLTAGPAIGTTVVTDGAAELQGTEFGIGK